MSLNWQQKIRLIGTHFWKNKIVDTFVSTKWLFLSCFLSFHFIISKYFQSLKIRGVKLVTKNTSESMVTAVFSSFLVTVLVPTPYENSPFLRSSGCFGDYFDAISEMVTIKNRTADFNFAVKENDRD